jgi:3-dehydrosphinganine reductase
MTDYKSKNVLITGGSQGIGRAIAEEFARRGANVFLIARGQAALDEAVEAIHAAYPNVRVEAQMCDVTDYAQVEAAVTRMREMFGSIDGVVNNAGLSIPRYFDDIPPEEFEQTMRVNYLGSVYPTKAAVSHLHAGAFITFTSSVAGYLGAFGFTSYAPTKFAQIGFAESLQQELAPRGIRVAVLCPPDTQTPGFDNENTTKPYETKFLTGTAKLMPAEEVARRFLDGLAKGKFIINCNMESAMLYRLKGIAPGLSRFIMNWLIVKAQRKMKKL